MAKRGPKNKIQNIDQLQNKLDEYFAYIEDKNKPPTVSRLAFFLGYASRQSLYDAMNRNETEEERKISYIIKKALLLIEAFYEESLIGSHAAGPIFWLKNRGWSDKQEIEHSGKVTNKIVEWTPANKLKK
jgi:hypothetical protein